MEPDPRNKRRQGVGDPGVLAGGTLDQTDLQDSSQGLGLALGPSRFTGYRLREGPQCVFQVPGPLSLLAWRCWARDGG